MGQDCRTRSGVVGLSHMAIRLCVRDQGDTGWYANKHYYLVVSVYVLLLLAIISRRGLFFILFFNKEMSLKIHPRSFLISVFPVCSHSALF